MNEVTRLPPPVDPAELAAGEMPDEIHPDSIGCPNNHVEALNGFPTCTDCGCLMQCHAPSDHALADAWKRAHDLTRIFTFVSSGQAVNFTISDLWSMPHLSDRSDPKKRFVATFELIDSDSDTADFYGASLDAATHAAALYTLGKV